MTRKYSPRDYQLAIADHIINTPRCGVWAGMGLGKSSSTLLALNYLSLVEEILPVLIIAPLRVAQNTWPEEVKKWEEFNHFKIQPIIGSAAQRCRKVATPADIYTINYENIQWLIEFFEDDWPFKMVIADESTKLKGFRLKQGTKRARALAKIAHSKIERFVELSGTPAPNGLKDLWGQIWFLDAGKRLGRSFTAFSQRWFYKTFDGYGIAPLDHAQNEIEDKLKDICISLNAADYFDLDEPIENKIYVDLPPKARHLYNEMEKKMFMEIGEHDVEAFNAASRTMKCLQLANGAVYVDKNTKKWEVVHDAKIEALHEIIEEAAGMPVLVAYNFKSDLARLVAAFPQGQILDKNPETLRDWNKGKIPLLFAHPASAGHGLNLQDGGNILVFFSVNWNLEEHQQIIERIGPVRQLQAGHNRSVFIHYIMARNTVDALVMERLKTKREVQDILLEAMKHRDPRND